MFGLTKREQRWKAEQQAVDSLFNFAVEISRVQLEAENAQLRQENASLKERLALTGLTVI